MKSFFFRLKKVCIIAVSSNAIRVRRNNYNRLYKMSTEAKKDVVRQVMLNTACYLSFLDMKPDFQECYTCWINSFLDELSLNKLFYNEYCFLNYRSAPNSIQEFSLNLGWIVTSNQYIKFGIT